MTYEPSKDKRELSEVQKSPTIAYDDLVQPIHMDAQYLLMVAGLKNGTYTSTYFISTINGISLDGITAEECRNNVDNQRRFLKIFAEPTDLIRIRDFQPNRKRLETFVNTTLSQMYQKIRAQIPGKVGPQLSPA